MTCSFSSSSFHRWAPWAAVVGAALSVVACGAGELHETNGGSGGGGSGGSGGGGTGGVGGAVCTNIAAPSTAVPPHVAATGGPAQTVIDALAVIFAAQAPAIEVGPTYAILSLDEVNLWSPEGTPGFSGTVVVDLGGGDTAEAIATPEQAESLFDALITAGAKNCDDPAHGEFLHLVAMTVKTDAAAIDFDDLSNDTALPAPDLAVKGDAAIGVLDAFATAEIVDCDPSRKTQLVCNTLEGAPICGYSTVDLDKVNGDYLLNTCVPNNVTAGPALSEAASSALWSSLIAAAKSAGVKPLTGTVEEATVVNASFFRWDGETLGCRFTADHVELPPGP